MRFPRRDVNRMRENAGRPRGRRTSPWLMLGIGVAAQASGTFVVTTPALLIPFWHGVLGMSLAQAGLLAALPTLGMTGTLVAWGAVTDRFGERWVLSGGLALTALFAGCAAAAGASIGQNPTPAELAALGSFLLLSGMAAASTNAASGRVVIGWFPARRRGFAMGVRQTCQPLGVAAASVTVPVIAASSGGGPSFLIGCALTALCALCCARWIVNPRALNGRSDTRPGAASAPAPATARRDRNPYLRSATLWRIHGASALLVVPQFTLSTFGLLWLIGEQGWQPLAAGILLGVSQFLGALGRISVGMLSDRLGSRVRLLRWVAAIAAATMAVTALIGSPAAAPLVALSFVLASCASVADNGLAYTAVAEIAGHDWSGRALGAQNTGQFLAASAVGPVFGTLIALLGFPASFLTAAAAPLLAIPAIPSARVENPELAAASARSLQTSAALPPGDASATRESQRG